MDQDTLECCEVSNSLTERQGADSLSLTKQAVLQFVWRIQKKGSCCKTITAEQYVVISADKPMKRVVWNCIPGINHTSGKSGVAECTVMA